MALTEDKEARLDFRVDADSKKKIERAAQILGVTTTAFAVQTLVESAQNVIERHERTVLSDRDRDRFMEVLDADAEPTTHLARALERYGERRA